MKWFDGFDNAIERALNAQSMDKAKYSILVKGGLRALLPSYYRKPAYLVKT